MAQIHDKTAQQLQGFPAHPFSGVGRDDGAQRWRVAQERLISTILAEAASEYPGSGFQEYRKRREAVETVERTLYAPGGDPQDRTALLEWLGRVCVAGDRFDDRRAMSTAHILLGCLMQSWSAAAWRGVARPAWADDLLCELFLARLKFGDELTPAAAVQDLQSFLKAHLAAEEPTEARRQRSLDHEWNRDISQACIAWTILASERPNSIPESLIEALKDLDKGYEPNLRYADARQIAVAAWERHLLEEVPGELNGVPHMAIGDGHVPQRSSRRL